MRLAYIVGTYPQPSETFIAREVEGLRARGHEVHLFSLFTPEEGEAKGVVYAWPGELERGFRHYFPRVAVRMLAWEWKKRFARLHCDAVVAHFGSLPSTIALEAAKRLPLFISLHARDIYVEAERLEEKLARATGIVTCTQANVDYLRTRFPEYAEKIHLVYHGLPESWLSIPVPERSRAAGEPLHLLAAGRLVEKKGFRFLLEACARLHTDGFPFNVSILGDGPQLDELIRLRKELDLREVLALEGWMQEQELLAGYAWADVFCCPSVIAADGDIDGLPNVVVEAMASGLPIIGSRLSGIPEAVEDGDSGLLVPPADPAALAIAISCCADPDLRVRMGARAHTRACECFRAEHWLSRLETILQGTSTAR